VLTTEAQRTQREEERRYIKEEEIRKEYSPQRHRGHKGKSKKAL
jgi:hypothetical protein